MFASLSILLFASMVFAAPIRHRRTVTSLDQAAFEEAQQVDTTATAAFSSTEIRTSSGECLFTDILSGDFRANLTPIQVGACNGNINQKWDVLTGGKHVNVAGAAVIVNSQTHGCMNFDPRRAAGNQALLFSCGGRADGGGDVTNSQLFDFKGGAGPLALAPQNAPGTCFTVKGPAIDQAPCNANDPNQAFTFGAVGAVVAPAPSAPGASASATSAAKGTSSANPAAPTA